MCRPNKLNCFNCNKWFERKKNRECEICGEILCPFCNFCLCNMLKETKKAVFAIIKTYEKYLSENFNLPRYDFSKHKNIMKTIINNDK